MTLIDDKAFARCNALTSIEIPNSVTYIGEGVFQMCENLTDVTLSSSLTSIEDETFQMCSSLTSVTIPNSVTTIENNVFQSCTALTEVTLGSSVTSVGGNSFADCNSLSSMTLLSATPPTLASTAIPSSVSSHVTLYVPADYMDAYKSADGWKAFTNIVDKDQTTAISSAKADKTSKTAVIYDIAGRKLSAPRKGINIIGGKKILVK